MTKQRTDVPVADKKRDGAHDPGALVSNTTTLTITVTGTNDAPVAVADTGAVLEDATLTASAANGVIQKAPGTDTDVDNSTVSLVVSGAVAGAGAVTQGTGVGVLLTGSYCHLTLNADGSYSYIADSANALATGVTASDVFTYTVRDPGALAFRSDQIKQADADRQKRLAHENGRLTDECDVKRAVGPVGLAESATLIPEYRSREHSGSTYELAISARRQGSQYGLRCAVGIALWLAAYLNASGTRK